ncbi:hypothetical protein XU18_0366 [Perkinsela sp. CCAP 1560/4]|nr:hypothetical protein XU18_0366 [Perkinsela sp. CCAP 1560/4]|eukprot:KNH09681.1 hypothetical protein XU18_0366 [Perkinsela sp. CCAP 1560/4]
MSSYQVFFRKRDPPVGSVEGDTLLRSRGNRNLNQKLRLLQDSGDWVGALEVIRNAKRGNPLLHITGWHYALVVSCFRNSQGSHRDVDFMISLHEAIISGEIQLNLELLLALINTYNQIDRPIDALKIIEFAYQKNLGKLLETAGKPSLVTLVKCLNRHGLWRPALDIANVISPKHVHQDEPVLRKLRAESHAMYGNWLPALKCLQDIEAKSQISPDESSTMDVNTMRFLIARAASMSTQWEISLKFATHMLDGAPRPEHIPQLVQIGQLNLRFLRQKGMWKQALVLMRFLRGNIAHGTSMRNIELHHSIVLDLLVSNHQWKEAMRYYMYDCENCEYTSDVLRRAVSKVLLAAGRPEAAHRVLRSSGVGDSTPLSTLDEHTGGNESAYPRRRDPSYGILHNCDISKDTLPKDWSECISKRKAARSQREIIRSSERIEPDTPLSYRWTPKAPFNRQFLNREAGYHTNFSKASFAETSPPPPTDFYNRSSGWTYWNQNFGLPLRKGKELHTAYNFSKTSTFQKIPSYKRSWKKYRLMQNLFPR